MKTKKELEARSNKDNENYVTPEMVGDALQEYLEKYEQEITERLVNDILKSLEQQEKEKQKRIEELKQAKLQVIEMEAELPFYFYNIRGE